MARSSTDPILYQLTTELGFAHVTSILENAYSISKSADFRFTNILGRSSPIVTYTGSDSMKFTCTLPVFKLSGQDQSVANLFQSYLALTFPQQPGIQPPSLCTLSVGNILQGWQCVCTSVTVQPTNRVWDANGEPLSGSIQVAFAGVEINNVPASQWVNSGTYSYLAF